LSGNLILYRLLFAINNSCIVTNTYPMAYELNQTVYDFLRMQKIPVAKTFLAKQLSSHPEPNSLLSITDTLDELCIPYKAVRIEKHQLSQIPPPFLVHIARNNGQFLLIDRNTNPNTWIDTWTGVILLVNPSTTIRNKHNTEMLSKEWRKKTLITALILSGSIYLSYPLLLHFSISHFLLTALSLLGLAISILILQKEAGINNPLIDVLCSTEKTSDCNTVLDSPVSSRLGWIKLSDIGLIYFSAQLIATSISTPVTTLLALCAAGSLPLTLFSLYYQGVVLRKWCTLCLSIIAVLWLQFWVLFPALAAIKLTAIQPGPAILLLAAFVGTATGWLLLKQTIIEKADLEKDLLKAWRLKRDPRVFANLIQGRRTIDETPFEEEIRLGPASASASAENPIRLLAVFNPYCKPCASEYRQLEELLAIDNDRFSLSIRFTLKVDRQDKRTEAVRYLLQYWKANKASYSFQQLLHSWFEVMNLDSFKASHPLQTFPNVEPLLQQHDNWTSRHKIGGTPALFLNGYEFPRQYSVRDLPLLRSAIAELITRSPELSP